MNETIEPSSPREQLGLESPVGNLVLEAGPQGLSSLTFVEGRLAPSLRRPASGLLREAAKELQAYFDGRLVHFTVPLAPEGTEFQQQVWKSLRDIPYGETVSYGHIAAALGNPKAVRAVGLANGKNPLAIVVPCHRVIGADGDLVGYAGGLPRKRWLLAHESPKRALLD